MLPFFYFLFFYREVGYHFTQSVLNIHRSDYSVYPLLRTELYMLKLASLTVTFFRVYSGVKQLKRSVLRTCSPGHVQALCVAVGIRQTLDVGVLCHCGVVLKELLRY